MVPEIDTTVPHSARIWNNWLGGKDNYPADQQAGDAYENVFPDIKPFARASREFLIRSVRYLAAEVGIRQFLDVGAGLPTAHNTHEAAQRIAPDTRVVYVDHDPLAVRYYASMISSSPEGACAYVEADMRDTDTVIERAAQTIDLGRRRTVSSARATGQPTGLIISDAMGHITDYGEALAVVRRLVDAMPSGSYLMLSHGSDNDPVQVTAQNAYNSSGAVPYILRTPKQIAAFFDGLDLVEPGLVKWPDWHPDAATTPGPLSAGYGAVARLP
ncbi:SAM-dependent methyltransferase [Streptomyces sp. NPDC008079]|uniref:SAM-dependent methyltransferase n=1 Tax=Streptomyces sp. NPDC008079 TaxID=3364806 RepID=UPI0036F0311D